MKILIFLFLGAACASPIDSSIQEFATSNRQFSGDLYDKILANSDGNILVSPFSLESVLALTQSGAVGATGEEIRRGLHLPETQEETEALMKNIFPNTEANEFILHPANKMYIDDDFKIREDFRKIATSVYHAQFENIDLGDSGVTDKINQWVEEETNHKIHDLLQPGDVDESIKIVLINALYFWGEWQTPFGVVYTKKMDFYTSAKTVQTETMYHASALYNYYESQELDAKILELPFKGGNASMTIILPNEKQGIRFLKKQSVLDAPKYAQEHVQVYLPKFKIESTVDFGSTLESLGVKAAFDPTRADFSRIAGSRGDLLIDKITQKTFIDFNEAGVEAAAVTDPLFGITLEVPMHKPTKTFKADHPFAFYIKVNDIILFEGRVLHPEY